MRAQSIIKNVLRAVVTTSSLGVAKPVLPRWTVGQSVSTSSGPVAGHVATGVEQASLYALEMKEFD